ncbi:hypothetical protein NL676_034401 [Syzygium grande]|nr:hypothetical protein NL676_034401 [Syzygium grande]
MPMPACPATACGPWSVPAASCVAEGCTYGCRPWPSPPAHHALRPHLVNTVHLDYFRLEPIFYRAKT